MCAGHVQLFATVDHQAPLSMGPFRQENWCQLPCLPREDLPNPGIEPALSAFQTDYSWAPGGAQKWESYVNKFLLLPPSFQCPESQSVTHCHPLELSLSPAMPLLSWYAWVQSATKWSPAWPWTLAGSPLHCLTSLSWPGLCWAGFHLQNCCVITFSFAPGSPF